MRCPECGADTSVQDTRVNVRNEQWRRRVCGGDARHLFTTYELPPRRFVELQGFEGATLEEVKREKRRRREKRNTLRRKARQFAADSGRPVEDVYREAGVETWRRT